jgi:hypothetical protein
LILRGVRQRRKVGDVVQIALPNGRYAYGRVLRDASVAFYATTTEEPEQPPLGDRDFALTVGIYEGLLRKWPKVGHDAPASPEGEWPPPYRVVDPISGENSVYERGEMRTPLPDEQVDFYERAAVYDWDALVQRLAEVLH